jgi:cleavage and polyadenylation specificity factor subunit 1
MVPESRGGKRLLLNGGVNFGSRINKFQRVRMPGTASVREEDGTAGKHATMFVTLDGGIGAVIPISELQYQQLERLTDVMLSAQDVARHAGLDPIDARTFRPASSSTQILNQRLIDTRLALEALLLSPVRFRAVGTMAGLSLDELVALCTYIDSVLHRF